MDTNEVEFKMPHHASKEFKKLKAEGLIDDNGVYVGDSPKRETPQELKEQTEASIPVSQVADMFEKMFAERMKNAQPSQQAPIYQTQNQNSSQDKSNSDDIPELRNWVMKDRIYDLCDGTKPISQSIAKQHTPVRSLHYTNKETQVQHILRYATNQSSFFVSKQSTEPGSVLVSDIIFNYGRLNVPASNVILQKFLAIHPDLNNVFQEYDPLALSKKVVSEKKIKLKASNLVFEVGEVINRAIASLEFEHYVDSWTLEVLEEEILAFAETKSQKYIDYTEDSTVKMKGVIKASLSTGELIYTNYRFMNKKRETILEVAKNQNEMDEMVLYFESGVGRTLYEFLLNKML
jgi:hypothetical protein